MGKARKVSVVSISTGRRSSTDPIQPERRGSTTSNTPLFQFGRRGSNTPLFHFSQAVHELRELQEEEKDDFGIAYKFQPAAEKVPPPPRDEDPEPKQEEVELESASPRRGFERRWAYKNVVGVGVSFLLVFSSFISLQNLQSTINSSGGLGLASLSLLYAFFTIAGFISPSLLKILGTKHSILAGFLCHLFFTLANFYPSWYTLVPASAVLGVASALLWAAGSSHLVKVAVIVAPKLNADHAHLIGVYTGMFFAMFQVSQIPGNLVSSLILFPYDNSTIRDSNDSSLDFDTDMCTHIAAGNEFDAKLLYILTAVYTGFVLAGILCLVTLVNHLGTDVNFISCKNKVKIFFRDPLVELLGVMKNYRMVLIAPISVFNGLEQSFAFGTFSEAFISRCFGAYQVGFTLLVLGLTSAITSVLYGKLIKYIPKLFIFLFGGALNMSLLVFLLIWTPVPSYIFIFTFAVLWGAGDGSWNTMTSSLTGVLFPNLSDSAYSAQRIYLALGFTVGFVSAEVLSVQGRVWFMLSATVLALIAVFIVEFKTQKFHLLRKIKGEPDTDEPDSNDTGDTDDMVNSIDTKDSKSSQDSVSVVGRETVIVGKCTAV